MCDTSPKTEKLWKVHLGCNKHIKRRRQFLSDKKEERRILRLQIEEDKAKLDQLEATLEQLDHYIKKVKQT